MGACVRPAIVLLVLLLHAPQTTFGHDFWMCSKRGVKRAPGASPGSLPPCRQNPGLVCIDKRTGSASSCCRGQWTSMGGEFILPSTLGDGGEDPDHDSRCGKGSDSATGGWIPPTPAPTPEPRVEEDEPSEKQGHEWWRKFEKKQTLAPTTDLPTDRQRSPLAGGSRRCASHWVTARRTG